MSRLISKTGQTANLTIGHPAVNMKWVVRWALVVLHTSATSGTREATIVVNRNGLVAGPKLADTGSQTGTSQTIYGGGDTTSNGWGVQNWNSWYDFPILFGVDSLQLNVTLISGDSADYYVMVEEEAS